MLISSLNLFLAWLSPFVLAPTLAFSFNTSSPILLITRADVFRCFETLWACLHGELLPSKPERESTAHQFAARQGLITALHSQVDIRQFRST